MNTPRSPRRGPPQMRRSHKVALILLGSAGVVGAAALYDAWTREREEEALAPEPLSAERTYANNHHVPGAGYYHAPYHAWFPFPLNYHAPSRGYFSGGQWRPTPFASEMQQSRPNPGAVSAATLAHRVHATKLSVTRGGFGASSRGSSGVT